MIHSIQSELAPKPTALIIPPVPELPFPCLNLLHFLLFVKQDGYKLAGEIHRVPISSSKPFAEGADDAILSYPEGTFDRAARALSSPRGKKGSVVWHSWPLLQNSYLFTTF